MMIAPMLKAHSTREERDKRIKEKRKAEFEHTLLTVIRDYRSEFGSDALRDFLATQINLPW